MLPVDLPSSHTGLDLASLEWYYTKRAADWSLLLSKAAVGSCILYFL